MFNCVDNFCTRNAPKKRKQVTKKNVTEKPKQPKKQTKKNKIGMECEENQKCDSRIKETKDVASDLVEIPLPEGRKRCSPGYHKKKVDKKITNR